MEKIMEEIVVRMVVKMKRLHVFDAISLQMAEKLNLACKFCKITKQAN